MQPTKLVLVAHVHKCVCVWCVYACVYVCICACKPPHQQEEGPTFLGGQFPYWLRLSPQTHSAFPPIGFYNVSLKHY